MRAVKFGARGRHSLVIGRGRGFGHSRLGRSMGALGGLDGEFHAVELALLLVAQARSCRFRCGAGFKGCADGGRARGSARLGGGTLGALLTGFLTRNSANANLATNLKDYVKDGFFQPLVFQQIKAILVTLVLAIVGTIIIAFIVRAVVGLRPAEEVEVAGLDLAEHGEEGYILN